MRIGFALFDYFPFGGLQRDCLSIASHCAAAGHQITVFTRTWEGPRVAGIAVKELGCRGLTIPARNRRFVRDLAAALAADPQDAVVGFNKFPGLDVYYGADPCHAARVAGRAPWHRWLPRTRHYLELERAVFQRGQPTVLLQITPRDIPHYRRFYDTEDRFHVLPPNATRHPFTETQRPAARAQLRRAQGWGEDDLLLLFVGSDFQLKGLDRVLRAAATLSRLSQKPWRLAVVGAGEPARFARLAGMLGIEHQVTFLGGRHDVPDWMLAADLLLHPARRENTGTVLVEALHFGLPVLVSAACGFAHHVTAAAAGRVLAEPFEQSTFDAALSDALAPAQRLAWRAGALACAATGAIYGCHERAAGIILDTARRKLADRQPAEPAQPE